MERSGNATFSLTGWSLRPRPMLYCSAMQFMFFAAAAFRPLTSQRRNRPRLQADPLNQMVGRRPEQGEERHPRVLDDEVEQVSVA